MTAAPPYLRRGAIKGALYDFLTGGGWGPQFLEQHFRTNSGKKDVFGRINLAPPVGRFGAGRTVFPLLIFYLNPVPGTQSYSKISSDMI